MLTVPKIPFSTLKRGVFTLEQLPSLHTLGESGYFRFVRDEDFDEDFAIGVIPAITLVDGQTRTVFRYQPPAIPFWTTFIVLYELGDIESPLTEYAHQQQALAHQFHKTLTRRFGDLCPHYTAAALYARLQRTTQSWQVITHPTQPNTVFLITDLTVDSKLLLPEPAYFDKVGWIAPASLMKALRLHPDDYDVLTQIRFH